MGISEKSMETDSKRMDEILNEMKDEDIEFDNITDEEIYEKTRNGGYTYTVRGGIKALEKFEKD